MTLHEKWFMKTFKQRKTNFKSFLRERISSEQIIQRNWSYKIQVFKIAAKAEKDKTQKESEDEKQSQQVCFSVLKCICIYMKIVTMIDSYKERNGYLCWFLSVFLKNIFKSMQFGNDNFK